MGYRTYLVKAQLTVQMLVMVTHITEKNPLSTTKSTAPTREECLADLIRVQNIIPTTPVTRSFYRSHGTLKENDWSRHFVNFGAFKEAAEMLTGFEHTPSREECIEDVLALQAANPDVILNRDFYRSNGKIAEIHWHKYFPKFSDLLLAAGLFSNPSTKTVKTAEEKVADELIFKQNYTYNEVTDTYITFLKNLGTNIVLSGERHRALKQRYSSMVDKASTINEICRDFQMPRNYFIAYKTAHGWTHDQDPFTKEEHDSRSTEDMVQELQQLSRFTVQKEYQKKKWSTIQANAMKWDDFEQNVLIPLTAAIERDGVAPSAVTRLEIGKASTPYALIVNPFDAHYGKAGWEDETGESYSRLECRNLIMEHTQRLTDQIARFGRPEKIIVASGSDWFHIDNPDSKTTGGTPQDCDGSYAQILTEGCSLAQEHLELLRQIAPVEFFTAPGNHDRYSALTLSIFLRAYYRDAKDVTIFSSPLPRQFTSYGNSLIGFGHGDSVKIGDLHGVMTQEAKDLWRQSDYYYFFTGHFHHKLQEEVHGITHYQLSSLSGADRWHKQKGYVTSSRALQAFMVSRDRGITAELISPVTHHKGLRGIKVKGRK